MTADAPRSLPRRLWPVLVRVLVPLALIALVLTLADAGDTMRRLGGVQWGWLFLAFICLNLQTVLSAVRWRWVSTRLGAPLNRRAAIEEYYLAQLINQSVPGGVVGDASRAVRSRHNGGLSRAAQAVVIERLAGQIILWSVMALGLCYALARPGGIGWPLDPQASVIAVALILAVAAAGAWLGRGRIAAVRAFGSALHAALFAPDVRWHQLLVGLAIVACNLLGFAFTARATGTTLSFEAVVSLVPLILSAMLIPATVAGWGYREGAAAALFPLTNADASAGLAASLAFGLVMLAASLPGLIVLLRRKRGNVSPAPRAPNP